MKRRTKILIACLVVPILGATYVVQRGIYRENGGFHMVVPSAASLDVESGGEIDIESGGSLKLAGTAMTSTAAELNVLDGVTAGTATASKAAVLGTNKELDTIRIDDLLSLNPTDVVPTATEGSMYWDDSENALKVHDGSNFIALSAGSGDNTLDDAYDQGGAGAGRTITADTGAVVITNTDADAAFMLDLTPTPGSSAATGGMVVTSGANCTEDSVQINNSGSGSDIQGTSSTWTISKAGVGTFDDVQATTATVSGILTASTNITFANAAIVSNDTNGEIEFEEAGEELSMAFTSNTVTWATDTAIDAMAFGVVDDLSGVGTIAFDAAASTITLASGGAGQDLTLQVTGAQNASLFLTSAGTAADAMGLSTSAGGIDITNGGAAGGEDMDLSSTNASVNITAGESAEDSIVISSTIGGINITAAGAAGGEDIDILATGSSVNVTATENVATSIVLSSSNGGIDITAASAAAGEDIDLLATGSSINITSTEGDTAAIVLNASTAAGGIDITSNADIDITTTGESGEDITISNSGGSMILSATEDIADGIFINATTGGIDITADGAAAKDLDLVCTNGSTVLSAGEDIEDAITISAGTGGINIIADGAAAKDLDLTCTNGSINITSGEDDAGAILIHANGGTSDVIKIHADTGNTATSVNIVSDVGGITLNSSSAVAVTNDATIGGKLTMSKEVLFFKGGDIASPGGAELTLGDGTYFHITGVNNITSIAAASSTSARFLVLRFAGALTFTDGNNLKLAGNFVTSADDTITLICDGTDWHEIARSAN